MPFQKKKIVIIGSGFGALSAGVRLISLGHQVDIYEKLDKPGGRAYQFEMEGFHFDAGPTVITAPFQYDELFESLGKKRQDYLDFVPLDPFYRIFDGKGDYFDYWRSQQKTEEEIAKFNKDDIEGYRQFMAGIRNIFEWFYPYTEKSFSDFNSFFPLLPNVIKNGTWRSMFGYASRFVKDDFLRKVTSFHPLLIGGNPFDTPSIYGLIIQFEKEWGIHYCKGGTGAIVRGLSQIFQEAGGRIHLNAEVSEIIIKNQKAIGIKLKEGDKIESDAVICNSDVAYTYKNMISREQVPKAFDLWLSHTAYSNSLVVTYFGTQKKYDDSVLSHHNLILGDDYRRLMREIFSKKVLPRDLGLYLHMPSKSDDRVAPEGCECFYVLSLVPNLKGKIKWDEIKEDYVGRILSFLEKNYLPDLQKNIIVKHSVDPHYFKNTLNSYQGAAFSFKPSALQSGYLRPQVKSNHFKNLYFVGAGVHPGAGVPAVLASGKIAVNEISSLT